MKFAIVNFLPLLVAATAIGERDANIMKSDPQTIDVKDLPHGAQLDVISLKTAGDHGISTSAICPPGYPLYCPAYNFCCPPQAQSCCPRSCCGSRNAVCGSDGLCYIIR